MVAGMVILIGCATKARELMPTPALFDQPSARSVFEEVPPERRKAYIDLLFVTDRAPDAGTEAESEYG